MFRRLDAIFGPALQRALGAALKISPDGIDFEYRGFYCGQPELRKRLEKIAATFLLGYNAGLQAKDAAAAARALDEVEPELTGFAFEGAIMSLALLDHLTFRNNRASEFLKIAEPHVYMLYVGIGCAIARVPWLVRNPERGAAGLDPLMRWLAIDGFGFHQGYFHPQRFVGNRETVRGMSPVGQGVFDQGLGRSLWFSQCGDVARIAAVVESFAGERRANLWTGIGLACAHAGIVGRAELDAVVRAAGPYRPNLALGSVNAVKTRRRAGNPAAHTLEACQVFCEMSVEEAVEATEAALASMNGSTDYAARQQRVLGSFRALTRTA